MQGAAWDARASGVAVAAPASSVTLPLDWRARCAAKVPPRRGEVGTRSCTRPEERCATNSGAGAPREWLGGPAFAADIPRQQPPPPIACPKRMLTRSPLHRHTAITIRHRKFMPLPGLLVTVLSYETLETDLLDEWEALQLGELLV